MKVGSPVREETDCLAVEGHPVHLELADCLDDAREGVGPVAPGPRPQTHATALAAGHDAIPIPLEFMNPFGTCRDPIR